MVLKNMVKAMANLPGHREIILIFGGFRIDAAVRSKVAINAQRAAGITLSGRSDQVADSAQSPGGRGELGSPGEAEAYPPNHPCLQP